MTAESIPTEQPQENVEPAVTPMPVPVPAPTDVVECEKPTAIEDLQNRLSAIENFLRTDIRVGSSEIGYTPYNGVDKSPGKFYGGTENPTANSTGFRLNYDGRFYATQVFSKAFFYTSDIAEKENVLPLNNALDKILRLQGVSFNWKEDGSKESGVIAQQVESHIPEAVTKVDNYYSVNPYTLIGYLIESVKELKQEIVELKNGKDIRKE